MQYKLIFVEGLPGTGKTTLSKQIHKMLAEQGIKAELLLEGNQNIPSNFFDIAGIPKSCLPNLPKDIPYVAETANYVFANLQDCKKEIANQIQRYDIGDEFNTFISAQEYARCTLEWWQNWAEKYTNKPILVLDSAFMQCPINEMIFRNASDLEVRAYMQKIAEIIKPFKPICVYLRRKNAKTAIDFAKAVKGESWAKGIEELADIGCSDLFERRFALENELLSLIPSIACDIDGCDWSDAENKIMELL